MSRKAAIPLLLFATALLDIPGTAQAQTLPCAVPADPWRGSLTDPARWPGEQPVPADASLPHLAIHVNARPVVTWVTYPVAAGAGVVSYTNAFPPVFAAPASDPLDGGNVATTDEVTTPVMVRHAGFLPALRPGVRYYYRAVRCGGAGQAIGFTDGTFEMPSPAGDPNPAEVRIVAQGETHSDVNFVKHESFGPGIASFQPHLIVDSGDLTSAEQLDDLSDYLEASRRYLSHAFGAQAYSNHNLYSGSPGDGVRILDLFSLPDRNGCSLSSPPNGCLPPASVTDQCKPPTAPPTSPWPRPWYSTRVGPVQVITVASLSSKLTTCNKAEQLRWLAQTVREAHDPSNPARPRWILVSFHEPLTKKNITHMNSGKLVETVLANGGADILLTGHLASNTIADYTTENGPAFIATDGLQTPLRSTLLQIEVDFRSGGNGTNDNEICNPLGVKVLVLNVNGDVLTGRYASPAWRYGTGAPGQEANATCGFKIDKSVSPPRFCTLSPGWRPRSANSGSWPGGLPLAAGVATQCVPLTE